MHVTVVVEEGDLGRRPEGLQEPAGRRRSLGERTPTDRSRRAEAELR
jgi:hypothetical protein